MGLDITHECWSGSYSAFNRWRTGIAKAAGLPPLQWMDGYVDDQTLPIQWDCLKPSPLHILLHHSDCEGEIAWQDCEKIADALKAIMSNLPSKEDPGHIGNWRDKTQTFIDGLRLAAHKREDVEFF